MKTWVKVLVGVIVVAVVAVVGVPFVYIHFIKDDAPAKLSLDDVTSSTAAPAATVDPADPVASAAAPDSTIAADPSVATTGPSAPARADGSYATTSESQVGYRVVEVLFGQDTEAVGRTNSVTGSITIAGTQVTAGQFSVDMDTLKSDESRRDNVFRGEVMETSKFPTATFVLTEPIELGSIPADGQQITATATGDLTLHGVTKSVTFDVAAKKTGTSIGVQGSTDVKFADYGIENPSRSGITTQDHGLLEFLLVFEKS